MDDEKDERPQIKEGIPTAYLLNIYIVYIIYIDKY